MKATGIVRRIDDLGRVVIPKEIRRTLRIREGDPLEIFVDRDGEVILKKYSPINELGDFAREYADALYDTLHQPVLICDLDMYIAVGGVPKKDFVEKPISSIVEKTINNRKPFLQSVRGNCTLIDDVFEEVESYAIAPIISSGDSIGAVVMFSKSETLSPIEMKSIETAASFLGKQMED